MMIGGNEFVLRGLLAFFLAGFLLRLVYRSPYVRDTPFRSRELIGTRPFGHH